MRLPKNMDRALMTATILIFAFIFAFSMIDNSHNTFADGEDAVAVSETGEYFVTFYDEGERLTVKTSAETVGEAIGRAGIAINPTDIVEPGLNEKINSNNFFVNIHRSRPALVKDGKTETYLMTASYDAKTIAKEAGLTVYDGDEVKLVQNKNFLETGAATVYELVRNGGRTVTEEEEVPFGEQTVRDFNLATGTQEVRQFGEVGQKVLTYEVFYEDGVEVDKKLLSEEITREPVDRIVVIGAKKSVPPEAGTCAEWARQAGVSEADLSAAIDLIYHESGCRIDAQNPSGAYGIPQALPGSKMASAGADWQTNPVTQIKWMVGYVNGRYGGWTQALEFWYSHGWY